MLKIGIKLHEINSSFIYMCIVIFQGEIPPPLARGAQFCTFDHGQWEPQPKKIVTLL